MRKRIIPLLAALVATALVAVGCGSSKSTVAATKPPTSQATSMSSSSSPVSTGGGTESGAAALRATLTSLLQEHVYLAGIAVDTGVHSSLTSPAFKAAATSLDNNSIALSKAIGSVYGDAAGTKFLSLWRQHIGFFVDYTKGLATHNAKLAADAQGRLSGYRETFAAFLHSANPNIDPTATANSLAEHVRTLSAAIKAVVTGSPAAFALLRTAAQHMPMTADYLAGAIAKQYPSKFAGTVDGPASTLRSGLTNLLQEHVYLAGITVDTGVQSGLTSAGFKAAAAALDSNTVDLSKAIGSVYGAGAAKHFLAVWRFHIGQFVDYTKGLATHNNALAADAQNKLGGYRIAFAAFLHSANPNIDPTATAQALAEHVKTLSAAIRAVVAGSPAAFERLRAAAMHMPMTADYLAQAIAKQKQLS